MHSSLALFPVADAFVRSLAPNKNYGTEDTLAIRSSTGSSTRFASYLRFDEAAISAQVGSGQLDSAHLQLQIRELGGWGAAGGLLDIHRVRESWAPGGWTETGVTWSCPQETNTANAGLDCPGGIWDTTGFGALTPTDQVLIKNSTIGLVTFDVTADVRAFLADTANHGWYLTKGSNANSQRIVFRSRERPEKPRLVLYMGQDSSFRLSSIVEPGVQMSLSVSDTLLAPGTVVTYSFTPTSGYQNVQVTLDDHNVPANGTITMSQDRVLIASVDRIVSVSPADQGLVQSARAVLLSSDPVLAYQSYLDQVRTVVGGTSPEDADDRLDAIHFLAYDPIEDSTSLRRVEEALTNHVFTLGDTAHADTLAEATTFVYVNGFNNLYGDAAITAARVEQLRREVTLFQRPAFEAKFFYNRTHFVEANETPEERSARCVDMLNRRRKFLGHVTRVLFMSRCEMVSTPDTDLAEAAHQLWNLLIGSTVTDIDARVLADTVQLWRQRGRHILTIPHSQGNLMVQQALADFRDIYSYSEAQDSTCVGALSLAAPVSGPWGPLPEYRKKGMVLRLDPVADHTLNDFPRMDNDWSRRWAAIMLSPPPVGSAESYWEDRYETLADSIHQARTYLLPAESRTRVKDELEALYHGCAANAIFVDTGGRNHLVGEIFQATAEVKGRNFEPLNGRRIKWSSSNPAVASIDSAGTIRALDLGAAIITARSGIVRHQVALNIHEPSPYPPNIHVFGTWLRTIPGADGTTCDETLTIDLDARLTAVCDGEPIPVRLFGVSVNAPYIKGIMGPLGGNGLRWNIALEGDGTTLGVVLTRYPNDPEPATMPSFTRP